MIFYLRRRHEHAQIWLYPDESLSGRITTEYPETNVSESGVDNPDASSF